SRWPRRAGRRRSDREALSSRTSPRGEHSRGGAARLDSAVALSPGSRRPLPRGRSEGGIDMRLEGKIALITASASGIGRAGAVLFAREGAAVVVADIDRGRIKDTVDEIVGKGGRAHGVPCDLTKDADSRRIVREAIAAFGGLDIVWNNVGHPGPGRVEDI